MNITNQQQTTIQSDYVDMIFGVAESDTILCLSAELASNGDIANYHATQSLHGNLAYLASKHAIAYMPVQGVYAGQTEAAFIVVAHTERAAHAVASLALGAYRQVSVLVAKRAGLDGAILARLIFDMGDASSDVNLGSLAIVDAFTASALYPDAHTIFPGTGAAMVCVPASDAA